MARQTPITFYAADLRAFSPGDYEGLSDLLNRACPEDHRTADALRFRDERRDPRCRHGRWILERDGGLIGMAEFDQYAEIYHPRRYVAQIVVDPAFEGRGAGRLLYATLMAALRAERAEEVRFFAREDRPRSLGLLISRGFREDFRQWESRLDVGTFNLDGLGPIEAAIASEGVRILTFANSTLPPEKIRLLYELERDLLREIPVPAERTDFTLDYFQRRFVENPNFIPEACFVAMAGERWIGTSSLFRFGSDSDLLIRLTGVLPEHRRRGLATALKLRTIRYARDHGFKVISTWTASNNEGINAVNERLGFVRQPALLSFVKTL